MIKELVTSGIITECYKFSPEAEGDYPAILWLHGLNNSWKGNANGIGWQLDRGLQKNYVIYCPQNPNQADWSKNELSALKTLVDNGSHPYKIVTGYSQGGIGTIASINFFQGFWDAAGIVSGKTGLTNYSDFIDVKIKAWHSLTDSVVGTSVFKFIDGVSLAGGDATIKKYSVPSGASGHDICDKAYNTTDVESFWHWADSLYTPVGNVPETVISTAILNNYAIFTTLNGSYKVAVTPI